MSLTKAKGNMYDWVTHMHTHLGGECPHKCSYCYVQRNRFGVSPKYKGQVRLLTPELDVNYGKGKIIFIEHMNDLFADGVDADWIRPILEHCNKYPDNKYVFQTKNPHRATAFTYQFPPNIMIGTTIETNRFALTESNSKAPDPSDRVEYIKMLRVHDGYKTFITLEPIMDFDVNIMTDWIISAAPSFVNIGADSKGTGLIEPSADKILALVENLRVANITIKKKVNLGRILGGHNA